MSDKKPFTVLPKSHSVKACSPSHLHPTPNRDVLSSIQAQPRRARPHEVFGEVASLMSEVNVQDLNKDILFGLISDIEKFEKYSKVDDVDSLLELGGFYENSDDSGDELLPSFELPRSDDPVNHLSTHKTFSHELQAHPPSIANPLPSVFKPSIKPETEVRVTGLLSQGFSDSHPMPSHQQREVIKPESMGKSSKKCKKLEMKISKHSLRDPRITKILNRVRQFIPYSPYPSDICQVKSAHCPSLNTQPDKAVFSGIHTGHAKNHCTDNPETQVNIPIQDFNMNPTSSQTL